jgi:hypothetical protein
MLRCNPAHVAAAEQHDQEHEQHPGATPCNAVERTVGAFTNGRNKSTPEQA